MSLQTTADGLLETHVAWEDVERKLQSALKTSARFGKNKSVVHVGEGNGFSSRIGLVTCDWEGAKESEKLPEKFALKMASCLPVAKMLKSTHDHLKFAYFENFLRDNHNAEVKAYKFIRRFEKGVAVPRCFYTVPFSEENRLAGSIALEYMENTRISHLYETLSISQMKQIAREIGVLQGLSILNGVEKEEWLTMSDRDVFTAFWKNFTIDVFTQKFTPLKRMDETMADCVDTCIELIPDYYGSNLLCTLHNQYGVRPVLVNGDLWSANVLIDKDTKQIRGLIDWQLVHHGTGVEDLLRIAFSGMGTRDRRDNMDDLLDTMYDSLLATLQGAPAPYSREQMRDLYKLVLPHACFFFAPVVLPSLMRTLGDPTLTEAEKERRKAVVMDKFRGICEDIVTYHKRNENKRKFEWKDPYFAPSAASTTN